jgi:SAM-dependent methyltransferase
MSSFWDRLYQTDNSFFGEDPSNFALSCYNEYMEKNNLKKILELGCGQGRDTLFFVSKGVEIAALDYSSVAIDRLIKRAKEMNFLSNIQTSIFDASGNNTIPFDKDEFDAVYSHMFFNMRFSLHAHGQFAIYYHYSTAASDARDDVT